MSLAAFRSKLHLAHYGEKDHEWLMSSETVGASKDVEKFFSLPPQTWMSQGPAPQTQFLLKSPANWPMSLKNFEHTFMANRRARNGALGLPRSKTRG